ncbi:thioesterase superfamily protein, partial [Monoraphidium neglectum]
MGSCVSKPTASGAAAPTTDALLDLQQRLAAAEEQLRALRLAQAQVEQQQQFKEKEKEQEKLQRPEQSRALVVAAATNGAGAPRAAPPLDAQSPAPPRVSDASGHSGAAAPPTPPARQGSGGALAQALSAVAVPPAPPSAVPLPAAVPMETTRIVMNQIVAPSECDGLGICTGGQVLSWIDVCAGLSAKTLARGPCVTISVDAVHFIRPCRLGQVVIVAAMVNRTFSSSMEVGVRVEAEDMRTGVRYHCCSAYLTFVSLRGRAQRGAAAAAAASAAAATTPAAALVAQDSKSRPLPRIVPAGPEQQATYEQAEGRRQARLARRQSLASDPRRAEEVENSRLRPVTHREGCPTLPPPLTLLPATLDGRANGEKARVSPAATTAYMTQSIMPQHANTLGITFGGQ